MVEQTVTALITTWHFGFLLGGKRIKRGCIESHQWCHPGPSADCAGANLIGANLSHMNLANANFSYADLSGADLRSAIYLARI